MTAEPRFIQIHWLAGYPGVLLNRDDTGLAKRLPFGSATRTRVSSQSLKRHWRIAEDEHGLSEIGVPTSVRSKEIIEREVIRPLEAKGFDAAIVAAVRKGFVEALYGAKASDLKQRQALILGWPEVRYLAAEAEKIAAGAPDAKAAVAACKEFVSSGRANLSALKDQSAFPYGLEVALFGRMVTSDPAANKDAAVHVAHAFTVHGEQPEQDYFTVVDDLKQADTSEDAGAAGVFDTELTSGLYYGYVVIDVPQLVMNLEGCDRSEWKAADRALSGKVVEHLIHLIAKVSPGAKRGSTAPYAHAEFMLVEMGRRQPRTLANAFREPVALTGKGPLDKRTSDQLAGYLAAMDTLHDPHEARLQAALPGLALGAVPTLTIPAMAAAVNAAIVAGGA